MLIVLGVVLARAVSSGQPAWVLVGLIGPLALLVAARASRRARR